jgi:hypothetical protein
VGQRITTMRCTICNALLTDQEIVKKYGENHELAGEYLDICTECLLAILDIEPELDIEREENE